MNSQKRFPAVAAIAAVALLGGMQLAATAEAKTKVFRSTKAVNLPVPNKIPQGYDGVLLSAINVPKKFKGKTTSVLKVSFQTSGSSANAADDLDFELVAPNGRTIDLVGGLPGTSIGPLTLSPNTSTQICAAEEGEFCRDPDAALYPPFFGTARQPSLALYTGVFMQGRWTLVVSDTGGPNTTSTLNQWGLTITPEKPVK
jgi:hypothetical protein